MINIQKELLLAQCFLAGKYDCSFEFNFPVPTSTEEIQQTTIDENTSIVDATDDTVSNQPNSNESSMYPGRSLIQIFE